MKSIDCRNCEILEFPKFGDLSRGYLTFLESTKDVPFEIKRVYFIYSVSDKSQIRGPHAHKKTEQVFFNINGSATYHLDDGNIKNTLRMSEPNLGLYIGPNVWHYMSDIEEGVCFLVVSSSYYEETDYIRNYEDFLTFSSNNKL